MELLEQDITPRKIMTAPALENALKVNLAIGGSLNSVLHLPALAYELGLKLSYDDFERLSQEIPHLTNVEPAVPMPLRNWMMPVGSPG